MAADAATLLLIRRWVGSSPADSDLSDRFDRLGSVEFVALEVLETRRADLVADGRSLSISGHGSQGSASDQIKALDTDLARLRAIISGNPSGMSMARLTRSDLRR